MPIINGTPERQGDVVGSLVKRCLDRPVSRRPQLPPQSLRTEKQKKVGEKAFRWMERILNKKEDRRKFLGSLRIAFFARLGLSTLASSFFTALVAACSGKSETTDARFVGPTFKWPYNELPKPKDYDAFDQDKNIFLKKVAGRLTLVIKELYLAALAPLGVRKDATDPNDINRLKRLRTLLRDYFEKMIISKSEVPLPVSLATFQKEFAAGNDKIGLSENWFDQWSTIDWNDLLEILGVVLSVDQIKDALGLLALFLDHYNVAADKALFIPKSNQLDSKVREPLEKLHQLDYLIIPEETFHPPLIVGLGSRNANEYVLKINDQTHIVPGYVYMSLHFDKSNHATDLHFYFDPNGHGKLHGRYRWGVPYPTNHADSVFLFDNGGYSHVPLKTEIGWVTDLTHEIVSGSQMSHWGMLTPLQFMERIMRSLITQEENAFFQPADGNLINALIQEKIGNTRGEHRSPEQWGVVTQDDLTVYRATINAVPPGNLLEKAKTSVGLGKSAWSSTTPLALLHKGEILQIYHRRVIINGEEYIVWHDGGDRVGSASLLIKLSDLMAGGGIVLSQIATFDKIASIINTVGLKLILPNVISGLSSHVVSGALVLKAGEQLTAILRRIIDAQKKR